ncbi:MAG: LuxR C-terminal-related transcriptional regulator [Actinomycetota bacterium]|nr:LuxR C-terminal-related transcriptional regulator [Actinomycetota bacterium]
MSPDAAGDASPLLRMKLAPPVPASNNLLTRPDLVSELVDTGWKICLISAPAGWGKTSLVAAWHSAESEHRPFAFLRLEERDDDSPIFWTYVIAALRTVHPRLVAGADAALRTAEMNPMRQIVPMLINELAEIKEPTVLVLDDYHLVGREDIHTSVAHLIDHLPESLRLVIVTRSDPPLPVSRLRASGAMVEIRAGQLGFSSAEAAEFLDRRFGVELDTQSTENLRHRTEGWPAGLQLAGLSLVGESDPRDFVERFAGDDRNVADYLITEVFRGVSTDRREFLLRTSVLERLTGPLCDAVAGVSNSAAILEDLERANMFLVPLDHRRRWYRYHHLFGYWLLYELQKAQPEAIPKLHLTASRWHEENGSLESAINHAIASGEGDHAAGLIDMYLTDWGQVHWSRVAQWLAQLPDDIIAAHALCAIGRVRFALARGDFSGGWRWIEAAEAATDSAPNGLGSMVRATTAQYRAFGELVAGDMDTARVRSVEVADQERTAGSSLYALAVGIAGLATFWSVGALESIPLLREASVARAEHSISDSGVTALLATAYAEIGDWSGAEAAAAAAFAQPVPPEWHRYPDVMAAHYASGKVLIAQGSRDEGIAQIRQGLELARGWVEPIFIAYGCLALADGLTDYSGKRALVREARQIVEAGGSRGRVMDLVVAAERKLALRRPSHRTDGMVHVEPLTDRERDVLRLLSSDLSLREIATELYVSHNTVKGHTKSVYRKLGVTSRAAAIEMADALNL